MTMAKIWQLQQWPNPTILATGWFNNKGYIPLPSLSSPPHYCSTPQWFWTRHLQESGSWGPADPSSWRWSGSGVGELLLLVSECTSPRRDRAWHSRVHPGLSLPSVQWSEEKQLKTSQQTGSSMLRRCATNAPSSCGNCKGARDSWFFLTMREQVSRTQLLAVSKWLYASATCATCIL